jgi:predicted ATPase with chaperone activity
VTRIYSVADALPPEMMVWTRRFRAPHHAISQAGPVGGGNWLPPAEISLAHRGVLFLDEKTEAKCLKRLCVQSPATAFRGTCRGAGTSDILLASTGA